MQEFYSYQVAAAKEEVKAAEARLQGLRRSLAHLRSMRAQPLQLQANLHQAESGVALAEAGRDLADAERARVVAAPSEESVAVADARVSQSEAARALVLWHVQRHTISAPSSGQVLDVLIEPGELAMVGVPLLTLADVSKMVVRVYVSSADLHRITLGESLAVEVSGVPGQQLAGEVVYVAEKAQFRPNNVLNPEDRGDMVFLVKVRIANPDNALKPGMPADILLPKPSSSTGF